MVLSVGVCRCLWVCGRLRLNPSLSVHVGGLLWVSDGLLAWLSVGPCGSPWFSPRSFVGACRCVGGSVGARRCTSGSVGLLGSPWVRDVFVWLGRGLHESLRGALWAPSGCVAVFVSLRRSSSISVGLCGSQRVFGVGVAWVSVGPHGCPWVSLCGFVVPCKCVWGSV